jgi:hypothetical protein
MIKKHSRLRILIFVLFVVVTTAYAFHGSPSENDQLDLRVHEWGTFTSIAGQNGEAVLWRPSGGPTDLPCFVNRFRQPFRFKGDIPGTVRMETPVLYFYASRELTANVKVLFPKNVITEWYPRAIASLVSDALEWRDVRISPNAAPDFPVERGQSHYYSARKTDAAPLRVDSQNEKFLFYRGVGNFSLPISAKTIADGTVSVKITGTDPVSALILFENRNGKLRYQVAGTFRNEITLNSESGHTELKPLQMDLENILVTQGLYRKEAQAMIETWSDSWFEEGTRLFYIVPRSVIDSVLPLDIQPSPLETVRVFVGRMEIITSSIEEDVRQAIAKNDRRMLEKYGRFLEPIAKRIGARSALVDGVYSDYLSRGSGCN